MAIKEVEEGRHILTKPACRLPLLVYIVNMNFGVVRFLLGEISKPRSNEYH